MNETTPHRIGDTIAGRYRLISPLGRGGMGVAYRAWDVKSGVPVALKMPLAKHLVRPVVIERFEREVVRLRECSHPHIVPIIDAGLDDQWRPFLVMQFLPGGSLANRKKPVGPVALHLWLPAVASALDYIHGQGVLHRDVKPANIFFDTQARAFLGDFGIAKLVDEQFDRASTDATHFCDSHHTDREGEESLTVTNALLGTRIYMAPELFDDRPRLTPQADQYSLAVAVHEMLCNDWPAVGNTDELIAFHRSPRRPISLGNRMKNLPGSLIDAVDKALAKKPEDRFATCREFATAVLADVPFTPIDPSHHRFLCPHCKKLVRVPQDFGGRSCRCPECNDVLRVSPSLDALWRREESPEGDSGFSDQRSSTPTPPTTPTISRPSEPRRRRVLVAKIIGAVAPAVLLAFEVWRMSPAPAPPVEPPVSPADTMVDTLPQAAGNTPWAPQPSILSAPRVTSLKVANDRALKAGDDLQLIATFSQPVRVTGKPRIRFRAGSDRTRRDAVFARRDGGERVVFAFEVPHGSSTDGGIDSTGIVVESPPTIDLAGGTVVDAATGKPAELVFELPASLASVRIDGVSPRVKKVTPPAGTLARTAGNRLEFRVEFDEPVHVIGRPTLAFTLGGQSRQAKYVRSTGQRTMEFAYSITERDASADGVTVTELSSSEGTIHDTAGNVADMAVTATKSETFAIKKPGTVETNSIGLKVVLVPAGEFDMGSNRGKDDQKPLHRVRITRPFLMGQTEVTQGQWAKVMGTTPWKGKDWVREGPSVAATCMDWNDAVAFCQKLTDLERRAGMLPAGRSYRLPTEAEWEYACRAGTKTHFSFGDDEGRLGEYAWFRGNTVDKDEQYGHEVGQKKANLWGLRDMHGNVWEWCSDWGGDYQSGPATDPTGPIAGSFRVIRGGAWFNSPVFCRSAYRLLDTPSFRCSHLGFRVVLEFD